jgi:hypothetical protein
MKKAKKFVLALKQALNIPAVSCSFVLYSENIDGIKEYERVNEEYIKLDEPIKLKMLGVYRHSFGCSLSDAMKQWDCVKQILSFNRFYHSIGRDKNYLQMGTKFNIFLLPIVYLYSLIDTKMFHKVAFV